MQLSHRSFHKNWEIYTAGRANNPSNWQPGHPMRFAVRGWAEYRGDRKNAKSWIDVNRINWNDGLEKNVDDSTKGQTDVINQLIAEIDRKEMVPA